MDKGTPIGMLEGNLPPGLQGQQMIGREEYQLSFLQRIIARKQVAQIRMFGRKRGQGPLPSECALRGLPLDQLQCDPLGVRGSVAETPGESTHHLSACPKGQFRITVQTA